MKKTFERAITVNGYIYNRSGLVNMLRTFTKKKDLLRLAKTRYNNLKKMFTSEEWRTSKWAKEAMGKKVVEVYIDVFILK
ncbi:hypothetical protein ACOSP7_031794 [Xanthoceras sorbifolium]